MKISVKIFVIITLSVFYSCTKEVDNLNFPEYKPKLVISGFISPDEQKHYISVGYNQMIHVGPHGSLDFENITGTLADGQNEIILKPIFQKYSNPNVQDSLFTGFVFTSSELPVIGGQTYTLKVFSDYGYAESSCTVPFKKNLFPALDTIRVHPNPNYPEYSYLQPDLSFTDIAGEENYYALFGENILYNSGNNPVRPEYINLVDEKFSFFNDKEFDGKRSKIRLNNFNSVSTYTDSSFLKIYLLNTDKPYYDYHKSVLNYVSGEIPFTEASPIYSNIKGGLGIFAAYTYDSIIIRFK